MNPVIDATIRRSMRRAEQPQWEGDDRPPGWSLRLGEAASLLPRLVRTFGSTRPIGPEDGPPVLVIPVEALKEAAVLDPYCSTWPSDRPFSLGKPATRARGT